jgi:hypothetical protein
VAHSAKHGDAFIAGRPLLFYLHNFRIEIIAEGIMRHIRSIYRAAYKSGLRTQRDVSRSAETGLRVDV